MGDGLSCGDIAIIQRAHGLIVEGRAEEAAELLRQEFPEAHLPTYAHERSIASLIEPNSRI